MAFPFDSDHLIYISYIGVLPTHLLPLLPLTFVSINFVRDFNAENHLLFMIVNIIS